MSVRWIGVKEGWNNLEGKDRDGIEGNKGGLNKH